MKTCITCSIVGEYVELANQFTQDLSQALIVPMWTLFLSLAGLWVVLQGLRLALIQTTIMDVGKEFMFVLISAVLLSGQGPELVNSIYTVSLNMMGRAASIALQVGGLDAVSPANSSTLSAGMQSLVQTAEEGVTGVFGLASMITKSATLTNPLPILYGLILVVPYFLVLIVYFAQVVVSIFRIMMLATLSPYLMLGFAFGWGRDMMKSGLRTLLSSFMVLFGATAALAVMLYAVKSLNIGDATGESVRAMASIQDAKFLLAVAMGWLGTAFMTEATGMANSISGSSLSNTSTGIITAGASASALTLLKNPITRGATTLVGRGALDASSNLMHNTAHGAGYAVGAAGASAAHITDQAAQLIAKMKK